MSKTKETLSEYSNWKINSGLFCLQDIEGNELYMQPRLLKLLSVLSENPNRVVGKNELIELVWDDVVVGEESLSKAAFDLRKFLSENFLNPPKILTIRKVGYRLEMSQPSPDLTKNSRALRIAKTAAYVVGIAILVVLVLRGLSY